MPVDAARETRPLAGRWVTPEEALAPLLNACREGGASLFVSGIDPGWAMDWLPIVLSGTSADIREIRCREIFNYALYDQPQVVREVIGFGQSLDTLPLMLHDFAIEMVWGPMVKLVGRRLQRLVRMHRVAAKLEILVVQPAAAGKQEIRLLGLVRSCGDPVDVDVAGLNQRACTDQEKRQQTYRWFQACRSPPLWASCWLHSR